MRKNYYLLFGSTVPVDDLANRISTTLDIDFVPHESSYLGKYCLYSGLYSDRITIEPNQKGAEDWRYPEFRDYPTLILVSNTEGKNSDKLSKTQTIKAALSRITNSTLLKETVREEDN